MIRLLLKSKSGLTLTELLVATTIIIIILLGVVSIDVALRQIQQGTANNAYVVTRTSAMMLKITKDVQLASGIDNGTDSDLLGIVTPSEPPKSTLWIKQDDLTNQIWICYHFDGSHLYRCQVAGSSEDCSAIPANDPNRRDMGPLLDFTAELTRDNQESVENFYVAVTLTNVQDLSTYNPDVPDPTNPKYTLKSRIHTSMSTVLP